MPSTYGTTVAQQYSANVLKVFFARSFFDNITNKDYFTPGDKNPKSTKSVKAKYQKYNIPTLYSNGWTTYSGSDITYSDIQESIATLTIDQFKSLADNIPDISVFKSQVKDPNSSIIQQAGEKLKVIMDTFIGGFYADAGAGNWIGTDYTTGTVTVTVTTGAVVGSGTTFTAGMVGKPFKATGHSKWYRVKTFTNATSIVIENDSDDETSAYDGGAIDAGATYTIQANTALAITNSNIAQYLAKMSETLTDREIPESQRWVVLPAAAKTPLLLASQFNVDIEKVHKKVVENGLVAKAYGMDIYIVPNNRLTYSSGYFALFGHKSAITAGYGYIDPVKLVDPEANFGTKIKGLFAYGAKVADERRKALGTLYATFAVAS